MAICNIVLLIAECQRGGDFRNYVSNCPYAIKLTGGSYGSHDNVYVEYMANSLCDTEDGSSHLYFEHNTFQKENHGKVIANLLDKNIKGTTPYPAPKPTISTRGDWCVKYYGLHVLAGEAKSCHRTKEDTDEGIDFDIFVTSNQLVFSPSALLMHSTNSHFRFYCLEQNEAKKLINVECREGYPYTLKFVSQATDPRQLVPQEC